MLKTTGLSYQDKIWSLQRESIKQKNRSRWITTNDKAVMSGQFTEDRPAS